MNQHKVDENLTFTHEETKVYCNKCHQQIDNCSECKKTFHQYQTPTLHYIEHIEMIECKDGKHTCIYCLEKRVLSEIKEE